MRISDWSSDVCSSDLREGLGLKQAYSEAMAFTGKVVALVGITLASGVVTWTFSPIKFQADMGILLTFMFIWNMVGAIVLIPALSPFLLNPEPARSNVVQCSDDLRFGKVFVLNCY